MGGRYYLHSDSLRISLPGCGDGLGEPLRAGVALVESARCEFLYRDPGGSIELEAPGDLQHRQGSQFTDEDYMDVLCAHGVAINMDGRGHFSDNIFIERLGRSLRTMRYNCGLTRTWPRCGMALPLTSIS